MRKFKLNEEFGEGAPEEPEALSGSDDGDVQQDDTKVASVLEKNGIASMLSNVITEELKLIDDYNGIISTVADNSQSEYIPSDVKDASEPIADIVRGILDECNMHVGKLQQALTLVSDHADAIKDGMDDAEKITGEAEAEDDRKESSGRGV